MLSPEQSNGKSEEGGSSSCGSHRGPRRSRKPKVSAKSEQLSGLAAKRIKNEVYLVVAVVATGRSPLNGWLLSMGAVAIAAETRCVLGTFARNFCPLLPHTNIEPAADVAGYLRKQRAELELFYRCGTQVSVEDGMKGFRAFCEPYANLTLVASPLFSVYGWLNYYWTHAFPATSESPAPAMPWGFSGVCAKSHASGRLGVPVKKLPAEAAYQDSFEGYRNVGVPLGDALAAAVSFSHLSWPTGPAAPPLPPVSYDCELPALLAAIGCIPASASVTAERPIRWSCTLPGVLSVTLESGGAAADAAEEMDPGTAATAAPTTATTFPERRSMLECVVDKGSLLNGVEGAPTGAAFAEYPSITDVVHHAEFLERLPGGLLEDTEWVATEKVHGSNFTVFCDGEKLWAAKRTDYLHLKDSSGFFDFVYLMEEARPALLKGYGLVRQWLAKTENAATGPTTGGSVGPVVVAFMCELAGGVYPHPNVPVDLRGVRVQSGVFYSPRNFLYCFDIAVEVGSNCHGTTAGEEGDISYWGKDGRYYLPVNDATAIFKEAGFEAYAQPLHRGSLRELLSLPVEFPSTIAARQLGFPPIVSRTNEAEGYVIRPARDVWVRLSNTAAAAARARRHGTSKSKSSKRKTTSERVEGRESVGADAAENEDEAEEAPTEIWARVILKRKHPRFDEFAAANGARSLRQHQAGGQPAAPPVDLSPFLTAGRVESVLSKYTEEERSDQARMVAAVLADALKDAGKL